ncbi:aromatase/cyclase [Streptomyces albidoflavus]|uniref:aromatase/cyclase n=1 Tax=Streptomyces albidoflavus TaxID=1886 RepID=UPI00368A4ADF
MSAEKVHRTSHEVEIAAPAGVVYGIIADTGTWPLYFPPNIHVERLEGAGPDGAEGGGGTERLRMWATANGTVKTWTSRRELDPGRRRIEFRQEVPAAPLTGMGGTWIVEETGELATRLTLLHDFTVADDCAEDVEWVQRATDTNSTSELGRLKALAERWRELDGLVLSFEDSVHVEGPAERVYDFLYRVGDWPERVPHVDRLDLVEEMPGVQVMSMATRTADGSVHTTESVRVCFPEAGRIVYKQTATPALMAAHTGEWSLRPEGTGVKVTSQHSVVLRPENIERILGPEADVAAARRYVREALGRNSGATLALAKEFAQNATATR